MENSENGEHKWVTGGEQAGHLGMAAGGGDGSRAGRQSTLSTGVLALGSLPAQRRLPSLAAFWPQPGLRAPRAPDPPAGPFVLWL